MWLAELSPFPPYSFWQHWCPMQNVRATVNPPVSILGEMSMWWLLFKCNKNIVHIQFANCMGQVLLEKGWSLKWPRQCDPDVSTGVIAFHKLILCKVFLSQRRILIKLSHALLLRRVSYIGTTFVIRTHIQKISSV